MSKKITLCGSTQFKNEFEILNRHLSLQGNVVYSVAFFTHADTHYLTPEQKTVLDDVHKRKIMNSEAILVIDINNYIGESTKSEISFAKEHGIRIDYLSESPTLLSVCELSSLDKTESGLTLISKERRRQIEEEGWTFEHDDTHHHESLAYAAATYATPPTALFPLHRWREEVLWPFSIEYFKPTPKNRIRELSKAGALCAAEIDRLKRLQSK